MSPATLSHEVGHRQRPVLADFAHTVPEQRPLDALASHRLADYRQLQALQVMRRIHPLMKDANNRDAVVGDAEINHMPLDIAAAIARRI
jgi:hypothetical protein